MQIFISRIPRGITRKDVRAFVESAFEWPYTLPFLSRGEVRGCRIVLIHDAESGQLDRHAIVSVHPPKAGETAIKRLKQARLQGRRVEMHEYRARKKASFRKFGERRRGNLEVEDDRQPYIQGMDSYLRTHGR